ncbi:MAG TPA: hypothetical protein VN418_02530 [Gammaproteobacteria bacterium]|nr:hypothetical protein [Gammaproteobacteria bacterium]
MTRRKWGGTVIVLPLLVLAFPVTDRIPFFSPADGKFIEHALPLKDSLEVFDMGVADVNGDDLLDIYTSNHNYRQVVLIADGRGGYRDVVSAWGLDQNHDGYVQEIKDVTADRLLTIERTGGA